VSELTRGVVQRARRERQRMRCMGRRALTQQDLKRLEYKYHTRMNSKILTSSVCRGVATFVITVNSDVKT